MKKIFVVLMVLLLNSACSTPTQLVPTATAEEMKPTQTNTSANEAVLVTSIVDDSSEGSLRWALENVHDGDVIQFDPAIFSPDNPAVIYIESELPQLGSDGLVLDGSNAGVILDGSRITEEWVPGLRVVESSNNIIQGVVIQNFPGAAIVLNNNASNNLIGGERGIGAAPLGQGNQLINNESGILMGGSGVSGNTISGNVIGTDVDGVSLLGNSGMGIGVFEGAIGNMIGPDNLIAYSGADGLYVHPTVIEENVTEGNSLFGNFYKNQLMTTEEFLVPPAILDFDFAAGEASGAACQDCVVRFFSTETGLEFAYEGETTADAEGQFTFSKGSAFIGPALMTQAITPVGRFSEFSDLLEGTAYELVLQMDNTAPRVQLPQMQSRDLDDNHIAGQFDALGLQQPIYDLELYQLGLTRIRIAVDGIEPQQILWDLPEEEIHPLHEAVFNRLVDNGFTITYVLMFWDKETYPNGDGAPCYRFQTDEEIERWLDYVRFVVEHFKGRVQYYEIWNEPDIGNFCPKSITLEDYANLVLETVPVIRETDPDAKIVIGGVSNTRFGARDYLLSLLENEEVMPLVDVISWHPMYGASPEYEEYLEYYREYPNLVQKIKATAEANGFVGEYHADELTWRTQENALSDQPWTYSTIAANKYFLRSAIWHLGSDIEVGLGMPYHVTPFLCTTLDGAQPGMLGYMTENVEGVVFQSMDFILSDGNYLLAVWNEGSLNDPNGGAVVDYDRGVEGKIYFSDVEVQRITIIDLLHGVEQEVEFSYHDDGSLIVDKVMVKDYPILIMLWAD